MFRPCNALFVSALFIGLATFADAQEKMRTTAEIRAEINTLLTELQEASLREAKESENIFVFDCEPRLPKLKNKGCDSVNVWSEGALSAQLREASRNLHSQLPESERKILLQLEMPVRLNTETTLPLHEALESLLDQVDEMMPLHVDREALHEADISINTMVTLPHATGVPAKSCLRIMLESIGLTYVVKNEMLTITTPRKAKGEMFVKFYYVGDILDAWKSSSEHRTTTMSIDQIIMEVVEPETWVEGDAVITMHPSTRSLAIRQTEGAHTEIEDLLTTIRKMPQIR